MSWSPTLVPGRAGTTLDRLSVVVDQCHRGWSCSTMATTSAGHDHQVAAAADAWLTEPRDTIAYTRLVTAIERRRAYLNPTLSTPTQETEIFDDLGNEHPPERLGQLLGSDPQVVLARLRT